VPQQLPCLPSELLGWLEWFFSLSPGRCRYAVALAATTLASAFGVAMTKQKMEELLGAGCDGEDPLQHKEQMGVLIGALHTR